MATESLIIELDAKTKKLDTALKSTQQRLDNLDGSTKKADEGFKEFTASAKKAALGAAAVATAIGVAINAAHEFAKEITVAANISGESVEKMQALAFATKTVGISLEKLGDISKDSRERIGEFLSTGGGGFVDFTEAMGMTKIEARELAKEFENMSGVDVLQEMTTQMEDAGLSTVRISAALEAMASDTTNLIPLLKDGGKGVSDLTDRFDELGISISKPDLDKITKVGQKFDELSDTFSAESKQLIADYSEELIKGIDAVLVFAQKTTQTFNVVTVGLGNLLAISQAGFTDFINGTDTLDGVIAERANMSREAIATLLGDDPKGKGNEAGKLIAEGLAEGLAGDGADGDTGTTGLLRDPDKDAADLEAIDERFKSEIQLLDEKLKAELELNLLAEDNLIERQERELELIREHNNAVQEIEDETQKKKQDAWDKETKRLETQAAKDDKALAKKKRSQKKSDDEKAKQEDQALSTSLNLAKIAFKDNKAISAGIIVAETAVAVVKSFNNAGGYPLGIPAAIAMAGAGAVQLAALQGASEGGGSISAPSGGGGSSGATATPEPEETSDLSLSSRGTESTDIVIRFATDTGDELLDALAGGLNERTRRGG